MTYDRIPQELRDLNRWVAWTWKTGTRVKPAKVPINPKTGRNAQSNNPDSWGSFRQAQKCAVTVGMPGIGFMLGDGYIGVDIDACRDARTGEMDDWVYAVIEELDSYTEISQSGTGVHVICRGEMPPSGNRKGTVEMYGNLRYFIMTGTVIDDAHDTVEERTEQLFNVHARYIGAPAAAETMKPVATGDGINDVRDLLRIAGGARNGSFFMRLWNGQEGGKSASEQDLALCNLLAFYAQGDARRIDSWFRQSALYRSKWDERRGADTYGNITIAKALEGCQTYFTGRMESRTLKPRNEPVGQIGAEEVPAEDEVQPGAYDLTTDLGRSQFFAATLGGKVYWCQATRTWLVWNGTHWSRDSTLHVMQMAKDKADRILELARGKYLREKTREAEELLKKTRTACSEKSIRAMCELAKSETAVNADIFDKNPYLLNCENGVVDLRTGALLPHDPALNISKCAHAKYDPTIKPELWTDFLKLITCDDPELEDYLQDICGMAAVGEVFHEGMCIFFGTGRNGKSTYLNTLLSVLGDYACNVNPEMLMSQRDGRQMSGGVSVQGRRLVVAYEPEEGQRLSSSALKKLSSTDPVTERRLYENEQTFIPTHTLVMTTNFLPKVSSTDEGTWRRIMVVPFKACIDANHEIKNYAHHLYEQDATAILGWIVEGAQRYLVNKCHIKIPEAVEQITREYRSAEDWLGNFIDECCDVNAKYSEAGGRLYAAYVQWSEENNERYKRRPRDFAMALEAKGYEKRRTLKGSEWDGIRLSPTVNASTQGTFGPYQSYRG